MNPTKSYDEHLREDPEWTELARQAHLLQQPPWSFSGKWISQAMEAIQAGRVSLGTPPSVVAEIAGEGGELYTITGNTCTCPARKMRRECYHPTAAELYRLYHGKMRLPASVSREPGDDPIDEEDYIPEPPPAEDEDAPMPTTILPVSTPEVLSLPVIHPTLPEALAVRSITAIIADLSRPLPTACVATKTVKSVVISYLHWQTVARLLDTYAPGWKGEVTRLEQQGQTLRVTYRLHIPCAEGVVWREATGEDDEWDEKEEMRYGNPSANAQANAFKRAAALFGCGQWLYDKPNDPTAKALADHFKHEKVQAISQLGKALVTKGMARQEVFAWLKTQTGVTTTEDMPFAAIRTMLAYVAQQDDAGVSA